jgi:8-oxo-dGTP pyrophosphatase MutT (NUDIX family)
MDALFKTDHYIFSYRVAGILIRDGKILLQKLPHEPGFAFPGGHAELGETSQETLIREFKEEIGADIVVNELKWVGENFFPWDGRPCHQICLYYLVSLANPAQISQLCGSFVIKEQIGGKVFDLEIHWVPLSAIDQMEIYPTDAQYLLKQMDDGIRYFVFREKGWSDLL